MKNKIGIAISLYNKFEELGVLIDIIRKNWKNKYFISVCSNYPNAQEYIKGLDIDTFVQITQAGVLGRKASSRRP